MYAFGCKGCSCTLMLLYVVVRVEKKERARLRKVNFGGGKAPEAKVNICGTTELNYACICCCHARLAFIHDIILDVVAGKLYVTIKYQSQGIMNATCSGKCMLCVSR